MTEEKERESNRLASQENDLTHFAMFNIALLVQYFDIGDLNRYICELR